MKFFVSDYVGQIKTVTLLNHDLIDEKKSKKQKLSENTTNDNHSSIPNTSTKKTKKIEKKDFEVLKFNKNEEMEKKNAIDFITFSNNLKFLISANATGKVSVYNVETGTLLKTIECFNPDWTVKKEEHREKFIGLSEYNNIIMTCTDKGNLKYEVYDLSHYKNNNASDENNEKSTPIEEEEILETLIDIKNNEKFEINLNIDNLCKFKVNKKNPNYFITGGKERDLMLWDLRDIMKSSQQNDKIQPAWKAKNVPHNFLDLRQPVWVTDLAFLDQCDPPQKALVITGYSELRMYDFTLELDEKRKNKRDINRPLFNLKVGENVLKCLEICCSDPNLVLVSDTLGNLVQINLKTLKVCGSFKGTAGTLKCIKSFRKGEKKYISGVGLDRFLRVWELDENNNRLVYKSYLKQKLSFILLDENSLIEPVDSEENSKRKKKSKIDGIWGDMERVS
ncbi:WD repeat-containing protein 74 [Lobulomyces angularis]|nr:WD repeat-containing protein 74 [Lobulomyces angularis]